MFWIWGLILYRDTVLNFGLNKWILNTSFWKFRNMQLKTRTGNSAVCLIIFLHISTHSTVILLIFFCKNTFSLLIVLKSLRAVQLIICVYCTVGYHMVDKQRIGPGHEHGHWTIHTVEFLSPLYHSRRNISKDKQLKPSICICRTI